MRAAYVGAVGWEGELGDPPTHGLDFVPVQARVDAGVEAVVVGVQERVLPRRARPTVQSETRAQHMPDPLRAWLGGLSPLLAIVRRLLSPKGPRCLLTQ